MLKDAFNRTHNYLRISLTERCNLRCTYCMPEEGIELRDKNEFMSQEELIAITKVFVGMGIDKIRLTGGEPLIKKNFGPLVKELAKLPVRIAITTNAVLLDKYFDLLMEHKILDLNISLDSLIPEKFNKISRRKDFDRIYENIHKAVDLGFNVKINVVLLKDVNDNEIIDFINLSEKKPVNIRFIEFMPFNGNNWDWSQKVSEKFILETVTNHFGAALIIKEKIEANATSRNFRIKDFAGNFGIISSVTNPFCDTCNRIRLTADGKIKNCLFSNSETDLLQLYRAGKDIKEPIKAAIQSKKEKRAGIVSFESEEAKSIYQNNRSMTTIGG